MLYLVGYSHYLLIAIETIISNFFYCSLDRVLFPRGDVNA